VKEESQIDEMRAALRGERERADQARQRSTENVRALLDTPAAEVEEQRREDRQTSFLGRLFGR
jgi:hypothetical protein